MTVSFTDDSGRLAGKGKEKVTINRVPVSWLSLLSDANKFLASCYYTKDATIPLSGYAISEWIHHVNQVNDVEEEAVGRKRVHFFLAFFLHHYG